MSGDPAAEIGGPLDRAAQLAAEKARAVLVQHRCPSCGRPLVDEQALVELLEEVDR